MIRVLLHQRPMCFTGVGLTWVPALFGYAVCHYVAQRALNTITKLAPDIPPPPGRGDDAPSFPVWLKRVPPTKRAHLTVRFGKVRAKVNGRFVCTRISRRLRRLLKRGGCFQIVGRP